MKTNKSSLMHKLEQHDIQETNESIPNSVSIIDGNALFQSLTSLPETFGELALTILKYFPKSKIVHFITDTYVTGSIKSAERERRGQSEMHAQVIHRPLTKLPKNWKAFLSNDTSKTNLIEFLLRE